MLGYHFGYDISYVDIWSKLFNKFQKVINLSLTRKLSFKGKSTVLNSFAFSTILYYIAAGLVPNYYIKMFQDACYKFIWSPRKNGPIKRNTLHLHYNKGGLKVPHIKFKWQALLVSHLQKLVTNYDSPWFYFAKYWVGLRLRHYNKSFESNLYPKSDYIPPFYTQCLEALDSLLEKNPDFPVTKRCPTKHIYWSLFNDSKFNVKCEAIFPQIKFSTVFCNIFSEAIDPSHRDICYLIAHDVVYTNYFLYIHKFASNIRLKSCYFCGQIETVPHLFLECQFSSIINRVVLYLLNSSCEAHTVCLSEKMFRFFDFESFSSGTRYVELVLISISRFVIWSIRNSYKYKNKSFGIKYAINMFLSLLKFRLKVDLTRMKSDKYLQTWFLYDFVALVNDQIVFGDQLSFSFLNNLFNIC